jgi:predicted ArsR family transcriptional regulator
LTQDIPDEVVCPWQKVHKAMIHRNRRILGYLREYGSIKSKALSEKLDISHMATKWTLKQLLARGLIGRRVHVWTSVDWKPCS